MEQLPEIRPEPGEAERKAILAALATEEEQEQQPFSPWADAVLPVRGAEESEP